MTGGGTYSTRPTWSLSNGWVTRGQAEDSTSDRPVACAPRRGQTGRVTQRIRTSVRVEGVVQGGWGGNDVDGVFAEVEGAAESVRKFLVLIEREAPPAGPRRTGDRATHH